MPKRKLVEIDPAHYRELTAIKKHCEKIGTVVPSMPALVKQAIKAGLPTLTQEYYGKNGRTA